MTQGIALAFLAYGLFALGDACVKALGGRLSVFEISFFACLFAAAVLPFMRPAGQGWLEALRPRRPGMVLLRAASGLTAGLLGIVAFTQLPFAEAYAIMFLAPSLVTILSVLLLGESVATRRWIPIGLGFTGVLLVVRPGFEAIVPAHLAALGVAMCTAATVLLLRTLAPVENRVTVLAWALGISFVASAVLMLSDFRWPTWREFGFLAGSGLLSAAAQIAMMLATQRTVANRIAPTQYSQILWAVLIGALFYAEFPDHWAFAGMALIVLSGILAVLLRSPDPIGAGRVTRPPPE
jgi:drug/metabolite transporter (DMT)-like permease